ncbi:TraV family lipoprotein, partial [Thiorhodococcus mannitoliphagus]
MTKEPTLPFDPARSGLLLLLLGVSLMTSGCGSLAVGEKRFGCKGHPSDPLCLPASRVYDLTNGTDSLQPPDWESERVDGEASGAQPSRRVAVSVQRRDSSGGFFGDDAALFGATRTPATAPTAPDVAPVDEPVEALPIAADEDLLLPRSRDPIPLRVPAQVMRIWLAPWKTRTPTCTRAVTSSPRSPRAPGASPPDLTVSPMPCSSPCRSSSASYRAAETPPRPRVANRLAPAITAPPRPASPGAP